MKGLLVERYILYVKFPLQLEDPESHNRFKVQVEFCAFSTLWIPEKDGISKQAPVVDASSGFDWLDSHLPVVSTAFTIYE